jgi:hypothetical protein
MIATTRVTVLRGVGRDEFDDDFDLDAEAVTDAPTAIPASLIEAVRVSQSDASGTPRVIRTCVARLPARTDVTENDRLKDEQTGRIYRIDSITQPVALGFVPELRVDCTLIN